MVENTLTTALATSGTCGGACKSAGAAGASSGAGAIGVLLLPSVGAAAAMAAKHSMLAVVRPWRSTRIDRVALILMLMLWLPGELPSYSRTRAGCPTRAHRSSERLQFIG